MGRLLSGHRLSGAILVVALALALMIEYFARVTNTSAAPSSGVALDASAFTSPLALDPPRRVTEATPVLDPFATPVGVMTAPASMAQPSRPGSRLTAILIANDGSVAVIDDEAVSVGGHLKTGERVASIQSNRVWVVSPNGQWRMLTLPVRGQ